MRDFKKVPLYERAPELHAMGCVRACARACMSLCVPAFARNDEHDPLTPGRSQCAQVLRGTPVVKTVERTEAVDKEKVAGNGEEVKKEDEAQTGGTGEVAKVEEGQDKQAAKVAKEEATTSQGGRSSEVPPPPPPPPLTPPPAVSLPEWLVPNEEHARETGDKNWYLCTLCDKNVWVPDGKLSVCGHLTGKKHCQKLEWWEHNKQLTQPPAVPQIQAPRLLPPGPPQQVVIPKPVACPVLMTQPAWSFAETASAQEPSVGRAAWTERGHQAWEKGHDWWRQPWEKGHQAREKGHRAWEKGHHAWEWRGPATDTWAEDWQWPSQSWNSTWQP